MLKSVYNYRHLHSGSSEDAGLCVRECVLVLKLQEFSLYHAMFLSDLYFAVIVFNMLNLRQHCFFRTDP